MCSWHGCVKESQRKGFCAQHLSAGKQPGSQMGFSSQKSHHFGKDKDTVHSVSAVRANEELQDTGHSVPALRKEEELQSAKELTAASALCEMQDGFRSHWGSHSNPSSFSCSQSGGLFLPPAPLPRPQCQPLVHAFMTQAGVLFVTGDDWFNPRSNGTLVHQFYPNALSRMKVTPLP